MVHSHSIFDAMLRLLLGTRLIDDDHKNAFLISDFGWSVILDCVGDKNPSDVKSHLIHVRRGVPTNHRGERKNRIRDVEGLGGNCPGLRIEDEGVETYRPRCALRVVNRTEYYGSRNKEFWLSLRLDISKAKEEQKENTVNDFVWDDYTSYRQLHAALWNVDIVQGGEMCQHPIKSLETARLGVEIATYSGWSSWFITGESAEIPQRICVSLTKGDWRARWLAIRYFTEDSRRRVMLRGTGCCEDCALDAVIALPGGWILIL